MPGTQQSDKKICQLKGHQPTVQSDYTLTTGLYEIRPIYIMSLCENNNCM